MKKLLITAFLTLFFPLFALAESPYFSPKNLTFNGKNYQLAYQSADPQSGFYLQEYLQAGDQIEHFETMLALNILKGKITPAEAIKQKISELEALKKINPLVNWQQGKHNNEDYLDIFIATTAPNGELIAEHMIYRYVQAKNALHFFSISRRAYGEQDVLKMANNLSSQGAQFREKALKTPMPKMQFIQ